MQKLLTFFIKNICIYAIFNDQSFNNTLTNKLVSYEQLDPGEYLIWFRVLESIWSDLECLRVFDVI